MNTIPLPDEIVRAIYGYINPAFEYSNYIKNTRGYCESKLELCNLCYDCQMFSCSGTTEEKIENCVNISSYSCLVTEYLESIRLFLDANPNFKREGGNQPHKYKTHFDYEMHKDSIETMEADISIHRGMWVYPDKPKEVLVFHSIPEILFNGSIKDIIYSCIVNNVNGFNASLRKYKSRLRISTLSEKRLAKFVNEYYDNLDWNNVDIVAYRKGLINKLMKI